MATLRAGCLILAQKLTEAAAAMCHADIQTRLSDTLNDLSRGTGNWAYLVAVFGDDKAGDVVYSSSGALKKAPYTIDGANCAIDTAKAVDVMPLTTYEVETKDATGLLEAGARNSKRDQSQLQFIHDATTALGAACAVKESAPATPPADLRLVESACDFCAEIPLQESARTNYPIKLISPGAGTTAHYPAKALQESADKFKAGTLMFWNHPTASEEASRPEGDLNNLAAITTSAAVWKEGGPKGPGLYAEAKVMSDYAERIAERAPHIGLSIRAGGKGTGRMVEGKPELASIDYVESVDYVTKAGRGGLALAEAARGAGLLPQSNTQESSMDAEELKLLKESLAANEARTNTLLDKEMRREAISEGARTLRDVSLPAAAKEFIIETVLREALPKKDGALDVAKFAESVNAEAKRFGAAVGIGAQVTGMGAGAPVVQIDAAESARRTEYVAQKEKAQIDAWASLLNGDVKLAESAVRRSA